MRRRRRHTDPQAGTAGPVLPRAGLGSTMAQRRVMSVLGHPKAAPVVTVVLTAVLVAVVIGVALGVALATLARESDT